MKPFKVGTKVEILFSDNDDAWTWTPATVVNIVKASPGFERHGQFTGNIVQMDNGKYVTVTEPGFIVPA